MANLKQKKFLETKERLGLVQASSETTAESTDTALVTTSTSETQTAPAIPAETTSTTSGENSDSPAQSAPDSAVPVEETDSHPDGETPAQQPTDSTTSTSAEIANAAEQPTDKIDNGDSAPEGENEAAATTEDATTTAALLANGDIIDYLEGGYYRGEGNAQYVNPDLVDCAEKIANELVAGGVTTAAFNRMLRTLKTGKKLPFAGQQGAIKKLMPQVLDLERKKKAPPLLREIVERNRAAVHNEADFAACLDHFQDIAIYLAASAVKK